MGGEAELCGEHQRSSDRQAVEPSLRLAAPLAESARSLRSSPAPAPGRPAQVLFRPHDLLLVGLVSANLPAVRAGQYGGVAARIRHPGVDHLRPWSGTGRRDLPRCLAERVGSSNPAATLGAEPPVLIEGPQGLWAAALRLRLSERIQAPGEGASG